MKKFYSRIILLSVVFYTISASFLDAQINFPTQSSFKYLKGSQASALPANWMSATYNDGAWISSAAPFWYGDGTGGTEITDMRYNYTTLYLRTTFEATNAANIQEALFSFPFSYNLPYGCTSA